MDNIGQGSSSSHAPSSAVLAFEKILKDPSVLEPDERASAAEWTPKDFIENSNAAFSQEYSITSKTLEMLNALQESQELHAIIVELGRKVTLNGSEILRHLADHPGKWIPLEELAKKLKTNVRGVIAMLGVIQSNIQGTSMLLERALGPMASNDLVRLSLRKS